MSTLSLNLESMIANSKLNISDILSSFCERISLWSIQIPFKDVGLAIIPGSYNRVSSFFQVVVVVKSSSSQCTVNFNLVLYILG